MQMVLLPARINDCCFKSEANLKANYLCHNCLSVILKQLLCKRYCNLPFLPTLSIFNRYLSAVSLPAIKFSLNLASGVSFVLSLSLCVSSRSLVVSFRCLLHFLLFPKSLPRVQYLGSSHRHLQSVLHDPWHPLCHLLFREGQGLPAPARWDVLRLRRSDVAV